MKKQWLSFILVLSIFLSNLSGSVYATEQFFDDARGHWAENVIYRFTEQGIVHGYPDGLCHPDAMITRAEFSALVARVISNQLKEDKVETRPVIFQDIQGHFAQEDIEKLLVAGVIDHEEYGKKYYPNEPISRMEIIRMMVRAMVGHSHDEQVVDASTFTDISHLSERDLQYISHGQNHNIITGYPDGSLQPKGQSTRAEAFSMLDRLKKINESMVSIEDDLEDELKESEISSKKGSSHVPSPQYSFEIPKEIYVDEEITIVPKSRYVKSVIWTMTYENLPVEVDSVIEGDLTNDGGRIVFKSMGTYTLTARAVNSRGRTVTHDQTISVYPNIRLQLDLMEHAHTDTSVIVDLITEGFGEKEVEWILQYNDRDIKLDEGISGKLSNQGGVIQFKDPGTYELIASVEDDLRKIITASDTITIYPAATIQLEMESITHTDKPITIKIETENMDNMELQWSLRRNSQEVLITDFVEGDLGTGKQKIRFKTKGVYNLIASATDETGRVFTESISVRVYPVGSAGFYLPEIFHTDDTVSVEVTFNEIGSHQAEWSLLKDGETVELFEIASGELSNEGGELQFREKGQYTLCASFKDDGGRTYSYEQAFKVYPVPTMMYSLPEYGHTDTNIKIDVNSSEINGLTVEWMLDNTFGFQDWSTYIDGELIHDGGDIYFKHAGIYELVARITDETGRIFLFEPGDRIEVLPVLKIDFELPELAYTDSLLDIRTHGNNNVLPVEWTLTKEDAPISMDKVLQGELNAYGGKINLIAAGDYELTASITDYLGRTFSQSKKTSIYPVIQYTFTMPESIHFGKTFEVASMEQNLDDNQVEWSLEKEGEPFDFIGELTNDGGQIAIRDTGVFKLTGTITDPYGRTYQSSQEIEVTNTAPEVTLDVVPTRIAKEGKFLVEIEAEASDVDGDAMTLEYEGRMPDDYYEVGDHIIRVRAKDEAGFYSPWLETSVSVVNSAPTVTLTLEQTRNTKEGRFFVDIQASATDADGDETTLEYEGRMPDDYYEVGEHVIRVRAKDEAGFYSPWLEKSVTVVNSPPTVTLTATQTRTIKNGQFFVNIQASANDADGDKTTLEYEGRTADDYYSVGTHTIKVRAKDEAGFYSPWLEKSFTVVNSAPTVTLTATPTRTVKNGQFFVNIQASANDADGDKTTLEYEGRTADDYYSVGTHTIKVRAKDEAGFYSPWLTKSVTVVNSAPTVTLTAMPTRTIKNGKFFVNVNATASDADGDETTLEYSGRTAGDYYSVGTHTIKVRAKDESGAYSQWLTKTFTVTNAAPTAPIISRSPSGNSVAPGTPVTITAQSTDPDGDAISYIWEGRQSQTQTYPRGKNVVRVKAVDAAGAESPWAAIVFFVADANGGGGMTLTGPDSVILEEGLEGATITEYTFTVPPVSGHSGSDFGRVRGYNVITNKWDQLDYGTTKNGITFSKSLNAGLYSQLEFYYYTNHNCMYNKSNITYSVEYNFE